MEEAGERREVEKGGGEGSGLIDVRKNGAVDVGRREGRGFTEWTSGGGGRPPFPEWVRRYECCERPESASNPPSFPPSPPTCHDTPA